VVMGGAIYGIVDGVPTRAITAPVEAHIKATTPTTAKTTRFLCLGVFDTTASFLVF
jgi:hypothetical protein